MNEKTLRQRWSPYLVTTSAIFCLFSSTLFGVSLTWDSYTGGHSPPVGVSPITVMYALLTFTPSLVLVISARCPSTRRGGLGHTLVRLSRYVILASLPMMLLFFFVIAVSSMNFI